MSLPKINVVTHSITVPSTNEVLIVRPFLVKEQKILLTAMISDSVDDFTRAIRQIVNNCVITPGFEVDKLELFDLEYLILQLRILSVGETTKITFKPRQGVECKECSKPRIIEINLKDAKVDLTTSKDKKIQLTSDIGIVMKYPTAKLLTKISKQESEQNLEDLFKIVWACVDYVYDEEKITSSKDVSDKEALEFLESLNSEQFQKIEEFISSMPKLSQKINIKCSCCDYTDEFTLTGLDNFFG
ncbi:Baseplate hub assembly protein, bacteriophage T4-like [uncultured Caudovirales phage]|uniref:Baseplate hub assembly protein, bacteriophage T4-like n=1 Tax=uncultured Caudovirales phage TaxID=2100421 RepID=A0A6J5M6X9_9CAUD|nr:Baseplate hub assembly protein, bacteriophage T4-like [uncultured Caudovirales phage]